MKKYALSLILILVSFAGFAQISIIDSGGDIIIQDGADKRSYPKSQIGTSLFATELNLMQGETIIKRIKEADRITTTPSSTSLADLQTKILAMFPASSGGGISVETDPIFAASPAAGISGVNITDWNNTASGINTSYVGITGNQTGLAGDKTWTGVHRYSSAIVPNTANQGSVGTQMYPFAQSWFNKVNLNSTASIDNISAGNIGITGNLLIGTITNTGEKLQVTGTSLFTGTANFTGTWTNRQLLVGSTGQGGSIQINRGDNGASGLRIGMNSATNSIGEIIAGDLQIIASTQQLRLQSSHASGSVLINTGGANTRMSINSTGQINYSIVPIYVDNAAAITGGLVVGDVYRTATGQLMIRY